jgi:hypothetical protein
MTDHWSGPADVPSTEAPFVDEGPGGPPDALVLDIGGDFGALILYAEEHLLGLEIDITPAGEPRSHQIHTMIRRRRSVDHDFVVGVFPELREGAYTVWGLDGEAMAKINIVGGRITTLDGRNCGVIKS